ncbi:hypothetical protein BRADI_2g44860v3 [Brachypodium distachyon]|uniref:Uncharacterized protein n=1 Tax=Brachypodium distachyon TaxID=15368 RepID=A0A0Q3R651_BRADI|nr:hypothetical protein BRADI_2g44860v3 [Brachypodium distachyon]
MQVRKACRARDRLKLKATSTLQQRHLSSPLAYRFSLTNHGISASDDPCLSSSVSPKHKSYIVRLVNLPVGVVI